MEPTDREPDKPGLSDDAVKAYDRIVERVYQSVEGFEERSWPFIKEKIEEAAELELAAREMTREELDLLGAYVRRDLSEWGRLAHATGEGVASLLKFDLRALEQRIADMFGLLADPTLVSRTELQQRLDHGPEEYLAGEVAAPGCLRCLNCGALASLAETALIEPCHSCGERYFHRERGTDLG